MPAGEEVHFDCWGGVEGAIPYIFLHTLLNTYCSVNYVNPEILWFNMVSSLVAETDPPSATEIVHDQILTQIKILTTLPFFSFFSFWFLRTRFRHQQESPPG